MLERLFEDILVKYPDLIEEGLSLVGRQLTRFGHKMSLLFEDRFKRTLIVELKLGAIKDRDIGQILAYEGILQSADNPSIRVILVGTRLPLNIGRALDHHGIAWTQICRTAIIEFLQPIDDASLLTAVSGDLPLGQTPQAQS